MQLTAALFLAAAGLSAASSSSSSSTGPAVPSASAATGCGPTIQATLDSCLATENGQKQSCGDNAWDCLCRTQKLIVICYESCPNAAGAYTAKQYETSYCEAAAAHPGVSSTPTGHHTTVPTTPSTTGTSATTDASSGAAGVHTGFKTNPSGPASTSATGNSGNFVAPVGGFAAALMGLAAML